MRLLAVLLFLTAAALLGGCNRSAPSTELTILAVNPSVGRAVFRLECEPAGGDIPRPERSCMALASDPTLVTAPKPFTCLGGTFSWWDVTITGRLRGRRIDRNFSTCWTPQMTMIGRLGLEWPVLQKHLLPRRHEELAAGDERTFARGRMRTGDLVTCDIHGHHLEMGVPPPRGIGPSRTSYGGANIVSVFLAVTHNRDGTVHAECGVGDA